MKSNKINIFLLGIFFYYSVFGYVLASSNEGSHVCEERCDVVRLHRISTTAQIVGAFSDLFVSLAEAFGQIDWSKCTCCSKAAYEESEAKQAQKLPSLKDRQITLEENLEESENMKSTSSINIPIGQIDDLEESENLENEEEEDINIEDGLGI